MADFFSRLKQRKIVQWALAYLAASWVVLQVLSLAVDSYGWPKAVMHIAFGVLAVGFVVVLAAGWTTDRWGLRFAHHAPPIGVVRVALIVFMAVHDDHVHYGMFFLVIFTFVLISTMWA